MKLGLWAAINRAIQKVSSRSDMPATDRTDNSPEPSPTKANDLLAFRTIITMLSHIQSPNNESTSTGPIATVKEDRDELRVLDALSAMLSRQHEITAVVAKPYYDSDLQVFVSTTYRSNAEPLFQPGAEPNFWSRVWNFTTITNPRVTQVNGHTDSLMNQTPLPYIGDHQDKIPEELVTAAAAKNSPLLDIFLENNW
jgi:hypothetical protein